MRTKAVRLYGKKDLRLESFDLPPAGEDGIIAKVVSDSLCMSSYKAALQGPDHKRVPNDVARNPTIIGHEFCGELLEVGARWRDQFAPGDRFAIQPALSDEHNLHAAPGYSFTEIGGNATYVRIPSIVMEKECLLKYDGKTFYHGSLAEPVSCIVGAFHVNYHFESPGSYVHEMGVKKGGKMALLAGAGPMGLGAIDYAIHSERRPSLLVVTDIDADRLSRAERLYTPVHAAQYGVTLRYVNTHMPDPVSVLKELAGGGYDDVFVYAPVKSVVEQADALLAYDGCLNFFAGPTDPGFAAAMNFYNVHYMNTHIAGNSGGNNVALSESLTLMAQGTIDPSPMITHIGGLDAAIDATLNLPHIPGGKKLIYNQISMPLTAIEDFPALGKTDALLAALAEITQAQNGLWCAEAEAYLLQNGKPLA